MKRLGLFFFLGLLLFAVFCASADAKVSGPHNILHKKGVCANCHIPHKAKGDKIWARTLLKNFRGVRRLCNSCHDGTISRANPDDPNSPEIESGIETVFGSAYESHVMHGAANIGKDDWLGIYDEETFPLDPNDKDRVPNHPPEWDEGGVGLYCGSCHNPHIQPKEQGDYLRTKKDEDVGAPNKRSPFCKQCHDPVETGNTHLEGDNCQACHDPHRGYKKARKDMEMQGLELKVARLILKSEVIESPFTAQPNVPEISEDLNDTTILTSSFCYGCHQARHILDSSDPNHTFWIKNGAAPIYGDQIEDENNDIQRKNHHPMGTGAVLTGSQFLRATGIEATNYLNQQHELTCISCHKGFHDLLERENKDESKGNNFLRWDFVNDNAAFCLQCHSDKSMGGNGQIIVDGKHFWDTNSPLTPISRKVFDKNGPDFEKEVPCRQCMLCHFIHDGEERDGEGTPGNIRADIQTLMRVSPINLVWADGSADTDLNDYEDMCYGCHGEENIVKRPDLQIDALLQPSSYFSHRFASPPDPNNPTKENIIPGGIFPLADGPDPAIETRNDYGVAAGYIYCGTCHNVHAPYNPQSPYLNSGVSPYVVYGFCEACHEKNGDFDVPGEFLMHSHPIDKGPSDLTDSSWKSLYYEGGSGKPGGVTGGPADAEGTVICLTCHNVHACATSHEGKGKITVLDYDKKIHGKLLVKDNKSSEKGSNMCQDCHSDFYGDP